MDFFLYHTHILRHLSFPPLATLCPSGLQSTAYTYKHKKQGLYKNKQSIAIWRSNPSLTSSAWPGRSMFSFPVLMSQTLRVLSLLPLTSSLLSADHATWYTDPTCPRSDIRYLWVEEKADRHKCNNCRTTAPSPGQQQYYTLIILKLKVELSCNIFLLSSAPVPDFDRLIKWGRGEKSCVRREEHLINQSAVACHPGQRLLVFCWVPQEQGEIIWAGHQSFWSLTLQKNNEESDDLSKWKEPPRQHQYKFKEYLP